MQARGQYEEVASKRLGGANALGIPFVAVPVREFRGAVVRPFATYDLGVNFFIARGYGGQTVETLALPGEGQSFDRITGFPLKSYVSASYTYYFRRR